MSANASHERSNSALSDAHVKMTSQVLISVQPKPTIEMKRKLRCELSMRERLAIEVVLAYAQDLVSAQDTHVSLVSSGTLILDLDTTSMTHAEILLVFDVGSLDVAIASTLDVVHLNQLGIHFDESV